MRSCNRLVVWFGKMYLYIAIGSVFDKKMYSYSYCFLNAGSSVLILFLMHRKTPSDACFALSLFVKKTLAIVKCWGTFTHIVVCRIGIVWLNV